MIHSNSPGIEGTHVVKRGDYYYMFHSAPSQLAMYMSRSTDLFSGWETTRVIDDASGSGHQGGIVQLKDGDWYGFAMLDSGPIGRVTNISPIAWEDDWPIWGDNNVIPNEAPKPILGHPVVMHPMSTNFDEPKLAPDWRWNHNPVDSRWSLFERPGYLRLKPTEAPDFWNARNTLTHKAFGPQSELVVELDISNLQVGDNAGLGMLGKGLATLAVNRLPGGESELVLSTGVATSNSGPVTEEATAALGTAEIVYLMLQMDFEQSEGQTAYSIDGLNWNTIGDSFPLLWDWATGTFQGEQYAIFNYNAGQSDGYVDINRATFTKRSDLNRDGKIGTEDYILLRDYHLAELPGDSPLETFAFGDVDGDLDNDFDDFYLFREDYIAAHSEFMFNAVVAKYGAIPEPKTFILVLLAMGIVVAGRGNSVAANAGGAHRSAK